VPLEVSLASASRFAVAGVVALTTFAQIGTVIDIAALSLVALAGFVPQFLTGVHVRRNAVAERHG